MDHPQMPVFAQNAAKFAVFPIFPLVAPKHSLKEVAAHETFPTFFRLNM